MNNLMPILLVLVLVICYCSLGKSDNNSKNSTNSNNNLVMCLLLVGVVVFLLMHHMDKNQENFLGYHPYHNKVPKCSGLKQKNNYPLVKNVIHVSPDGSESEMTEDMMSYHFPNVNANKQSPQHLFLYARNQSSLDCCPSIYSDSRGCICQPESQTQLFRNRNKPL